MARGDDEWVGDIVAAIADIRADTAGMDFAAFSAKPVNVRSVLYSIAVIRRGCQKHQPGVQISVSGHSVARSRWNPRSDRTRVLPYQHAPHMGRCCR